MGSSESLCVALSAAAGMGTGFFSCLLSSADHLRREKGPTPRSRAYHVVGVVGSTIFGLASLLGLIIGSVSLAVIVRAGTAMSANAIFSQVFRLRPLVREDIVGTLVTISGVASFTTAQGLVDRHFGSAMEVIGLAHEPCSLVWLGSLGALLAVALSWLLVNCGTIGLEGVMPQQVRAAAAACVCACSSAFMDVSAKIWSAELANSVGAKSFPAAFWGALILNAVFWVAMRWSTIHGCRHCDVLFFMPLNMALNIMFCVLTGVIVLEEYAASTSWAGLAFTSVTVLSGLWMLISGPATGCLVEAVQQGFSPASFSSPAAELADSAQGIIRNFVGTHQADGLEACLHTEVSNAGTVESVLPPQESFLPELVPQAVALTRLNRAHRRAAAHRFAALNALANFRSHNASVFLNSQRDGRHTPLETDRPRGMPTF